MPDKTEQASQLCSMSMSSTKTFAGHGENLPLQALFFIDQGLARVVDVYGFGYDQDNIGLSVQCGDAALQELRREPVIMGQPHEVFAVGEFRSATEVSVDATVHFIPAIPHPGITPGDTRGKSPACDPWSALSERITSKSGTVCASIVSTAYATYFSPLNTGTATLTRGWSPLIGLASIASNRVTLQVAVLPVAAVSFRQWCGRISESTLIFVLY